MAAGDDHPPVLRNARRRESARGDAVEADGDGPLESHSCRREDHAAPAAFEQRGIDLLLQLRDETAHRGLPDAQFVRGGGEAFVARGGFERPDG